MRWQTKAMIYTVASSVGGAVSGGVLGAIGSQFALSTRLTAGAVACVVLAVVGFLHASGRQGWIPQRDCETAQSWMSRGPAVWAAMNGLALGAGWYSRVGMVSWYALPVAALGFGSVGAGAVLFGVYGVVRGGAVWVWIYGLARVDDQDQVFDRVVAEMGAAKRLAAYLLLFSSAAAAIIVGT